MSRTQQDKLASSLKMFILLRLVINTGSLIFKQRCQFLSAANEELSSSRLYQIFRRAHSVTAVLYSGSVYTSKNRVDNKMKAFMHKSAFPLQELQ